MIATLYILIATAAACSILGVFLVLKNLSMLTDPISHSVILGVAIAGLLTRDVNSPFLIIGAGLFGLLTVLSIETLIKSGLIREDSSVGIIFPLFFSLGIILISKFGRNMHLDVDCILMGQVLFASYDKMMFLGMEVSKAIVKMGAMFLVNLAFVLIFFKELKINTFDEEYATLNGFSAAILSYSLMGLVSITAVTAFDVVGAILVIAFMIAPSASAYLLTKKLKYTILVAVIIGVLEAIVSYYISLALNLSMAGVTATLMGVVFLIILIFNPEGYLMQRKNRREHREDLESFFLLMHLSGHHGEEKEEHGIESLYQHLNRPHAEILSKCNKLIKIGYITEDKESETYKITKKGNYFYLKLKESYES